MVDARALIKDQQVGVQKFNLKADADVAVKVIPIPVIGVGEKDDAGNAVLDGFRIKVDNADIIHVKEIPVVAELKLDVNNMHIFLDNQDDNFFIHGDDVDGATATITINNGDFVEIDPDGFQLEDIEFE